MRLDPVGKCAVFERRASHIFAFRLDIVKEEHAGGVPENP